MNFYSAVRNLTFLFPPEFAHNLAIKLLQCSLVPAASEYTDPILSNNVFGLHFENPVGLAAGFDKDAECISALCRQGFGFIEVGTITLKPQPGNPKPRIFRLAQDKAIINSLGFNGKGSNCAYQNISRTTQRKILGVNIGKNKDTSDHIKDYTNLMEKFYNLADYITINISSPNTSNLKDLQRKDHLDSLLLALSGLRLGLSAKHNKHLPLLVKISPDLSIRGREGVVDSCLSHKIDGLIVSNTTIFHKDRLHSVHKHKIGGLSGIPLREPADMLLSEIYKLTEGKIPIIGVGGIFSAEDAYRKICLGASLVQVYTAIIYHGFAVVDQIKQGLVLLLRQDGFSTLKDVVGIAHK
jgi:dihydroorotate dehydrogenase